MARNRKSELIKYCDNYIRDVQELTYYISHKYPTLTTQQHTLMANDIRRNYGIEEKLNDLLEAVDGICDTLNNEFDGCIEEEIQTNSRDGIGIINAKIAN